MNIKLFLVVILIAGFAVTDSQAGQATNELGVCLTDSLNGKERKALARWIFFAIAAHPEMSPYSRISETSRDNSHQLVGTLVTRLMTEDCPVRTKAAVQKSGSAAIESAFSLVGQVAMQELMNNQDVTTSISGFEKYLDKEKLNALGL